MKKTVVWKFPLLHVDEIEMPEGAEIIRVGATPSPKDPALRVGAIWARVPADPATPKQKRQFIVAATGEEIEESEDRETVYLGTFEVPSAGDQFVNKMREMIGPDVADIVLKYPIPQMLVFHVFEVLS